MSNKVMCWRKVEGKDFKELFIGDGNGGWIYYAAHPLAAPDLKLPGASKGYRTMQKLLQMGYKLVSDKQP